MKTGASLTETQIKNKKLSRQLNPWLTFSLTMGTRSIFILLIIYMISLVSKNELAATLNDEVQMGNESLVSDAKLAAGHFLQLSMVAIAGLNRGFNSLGVDAQPLPEFTSVSPSSLIHIPEHVVQPIEAEENADENEAEDKDENATIVEEKSIDLRDDYDEFFIEATESNLQEKKFSFVFNESAMLNRLEQLADSGSAVACNILAFYYNNAFLQRHPSLISSKPKNRGLFIDYSIKAIQLKHYGYFNIFIDEATQQDPRQCLPWMSLIEEAAKFPHPATRFTAAAIYIALDKIDPSMVTDAQRNKIPELIHTAAYLGSKPAKGMLAANSILKNKTVVVPSLQEMLNEQPSQLSNGAKETFCHLAKDYLTESPLIDMNLENGVTLIKWLIKKDVVQGALLMVALLKSPKFAMSNELLEKAVEYFTMTTMAKELLERKAQEGSALAAELIYNIAAEEGDQDKQNYYLKLFAQRSPIGKVKLVMDALSPSSSITLSNHKILSLINSVDAAGIVFFNASGQHIVQFSTYILDSLKNQTLLGSPRHPLEAMLVKYRKTKGSNKTKPKPITTADANYIKWIAQASTHPYTFMSLFMAVILYFRYKKPRNNHPSENKQINDDNKQAVTPPDRKRSKNRMTGPAEISNRQTGGDSHPPKNHTQITDKEFNEIAGRVSNIQTRHQELLAEFEIEIKLSIDESEHKLSGWIETLKKDHSEINKKIEELKKDNENFVMPSYSIYETLLKKVEHWETRMTKADTALRTQKDKRVTQLAESKKMPQGKSGPLPVKNHAPKKEIQSPELKQESHDSQTSVTPINSNKNPVDQQPIDNKRNYRLLRPPKEKNIPGVLALIGSLAEKYRHQVTQLYTKDAKIEQNMFMNYMLQGCLFFCIEAWLETITKDTPGYTLYNNARNRIVHCSYDKIIMLLKIDSDRASQQSPDSFLRFADLLSDFSQKEPSISLIKKFDELSTAFSSQLSQITVPIRDQDDTVEFFVGAADLESAKKCIERFLSLLIFEKSIFEQTDSEEKAVLCNITLAFIIAKIDASCEDYAVVKGREKNQLKKYIQKKIGGSLKLKMGVNYRHDAYSFLKQVLQGKGLHSIKLKP